MNILFVTASYKPAFIYGGPTVVIAMLAENLVKLGHSVTVYTTTANGKTELPVTPDKEVMVDGVKVFYFTRVTKDHTHVSFRLWKQLNRHSKDFDVIHIHAWWNLLAIGAAYVCVRNKVTPFLSPHGMFSNYILQTNNSRAKKILHSVIGKKLLSQTILHVSTSMELSESRQIIPGWRGAIIPNLVILPETLPVRTNNDVFTIGFLSRIDPKKGLDILITALSKVNFPYRLLVAGSGDEAYVDSLKQLSDDLKTDHHIEWVGWKNGDEKFRFLSGLDLFALTSHSENFAIVVIESLSVGTPIMISDQVGLHNYVADQKLGWITSTDAGEIATCLTAIYNEQQKRKVISETSPLIIQKEYNAAQLTQRYVDFYNQYKS